MTDDPSMPDLSGLLEQAQNMMAASAEAAATDVEGSAGGGKVVVVVNGNFEFQSVRIDPAVVDPADVEILEDLVLAALRDAAAKVADNQEGAMGGLDLGDLDLGGLGGLLGGSDE
ncbi:MAG: YbaB/EbfC family nucleoid-associated protein [Acidimicrobiales bacterium]